MLVNSIDAKKKFLGHIKRCRARKDALGNPIEMRMTFEEWCAVWEESGQWHNRRKGGAVMSRHNDIGHYEVGNVSIKTSADNSREAHCGKKITPERSLQQSKTNKLTWSKPSVRKARIDGMRNSWTPEKRAAHSDKCFKAWQDPAVRAKLSESLKKAFADPKKKEQRAGKRWCFNPETLEAFLLKREDIPSTFIIGRPRRDDARTF